MVEGMIMRNPFKKNYANETKFGNDEGITVCKKCREEWAGITHISLFSQYALSMKANDVVFVMKSQSCAEDGI